MEGWRRQRIPVLEGRHLFHITAFNLTQVVKLADNTDSFTCVSHEQTSTRDTHQDRFPPLSLTNARSSGYVGREAKIQGQNEKKREKKDEGQECASVCVSTLVNYTEPG